MIWTLIDPAAEPESFPTLEAALDAAAEAIAEYSDDGQWAPGVAEIRIEQYGATTHRAIEVPAEPEDCDAAEYVADGEYYCTYEMQQVGVVVA